MAAEARHAGSRDVNLIADGLRHDCRSYIANGPKTSFLYPS
jgi:hypothetical protein